ncbi:unnamed protein product, partial [Mesorhabditis spiculigera]
MPPRNRANSKGAAATKDDEGRQPVYSEMAMRNNAGVLEYARTCQAAGAGIASGILGLTAIPGFIFYFVTILIQAAVWEWKSGFSWGKYFMDRSSSVTHSLMSGLFTYILFWVFFYGMVHVY